MPTTIEGLGLYPGFENMGVIASYSGDDNGNNEATLEYREVGSPTWKPGIPMTVDRRDVITYYPGGGAADETVPNSWARQARAVIFGLKPNTDYEVMVSFEDPDGIVGVNPIIATIRTRDDNPPSNGRVLWVSPDGSDADDGSELLPWRTVQRAADIVLAGDRVIVMPGVYPEQVTISGKSGTIDNYITFESQEPLQAVIDGGRTIGYGFRLSNSHYIRIKGFHLLEQAQNPIRAESSNYAIIEDNKVDNGYWTGSNWARGGIYFRDNSHHITIQRNDISRYRGGAHLETMGIFFSSTVTVFTGEEGGDIIRDNIIHGDFRDGFGSTGGYLYKGLINSFFYRNIIHDISDDDGMEIEGPNVNVAVFDNLIYNVTHMAMGLAPISVGPMYILRNIMVNCTDALMKMGSTSNGYLYVYHNTLYNPGPGNGPSMFGSNSRANNQIFKNNIIDVGRVALYYRNGAGNPTNVFDYNIWQSTSSTQKFRWGDIKYPTFGGFQAGTGQEANGIFADPQFVNPGTFDFRLQEGSPALDNGVILPGFNDFNSPWPYGGGAPDIGAIEAGIVGPPTALFSAEPTEGAAPLTVQFTSMSIGAIDSWLWEFGDGEVSSEPNPTHIYAALGEYTVSLTVTGPGGSDIAEQVEPIVVTVPPVTYTLTIAATQGGTTNPAEGSYTHQEGIAVLVTALPGPGFTFLEWTENGLLLSTDNPLSILMDADKSITAVFEAVVTPPGEFSVSISILGQGTTSPVPDTYIIAEGASMTVEAIPSPGYKFDHWEGDIAGMPNPATFQVTVDMSIIAVFVEKPPTPFPVMVPLIAISVLGIIIAAVSRRKV